LDDGYAKLLGVFFSRRNQPLFFEADMSSGWVVRLNCPAMMLNWTLGVMPPGGHFGILWTTTMSSIWFMLLLLLLLSIVVVSL
jgi:hypothetical protein